MTRLKLQNIVSEEHRVLFIINSWTLKYHLCIVVGTFVICADFSILFVCNYKNQFSSVQNSMSL